MKNLSNTFFILILMLGVSTLQAQTVVQSWDFESSMANWVSGGGGASIELSTDMARGGSQSLKMVGAAAATEVNLQNDSYKPTENDSINFWIWISSADLAYVTGVQVFWQDGSGWAWHSKWVNGTDMTGDTWNQIGVTFPAITSPLQRIGLQLSQLTGAPTMYVDDITVTSPVVPVELVSFSANVIDNKVSLTWETATELNNAGFEVQRSIDKVNFAAVGFVKGNGTTTESHSYSFVDNITNSGTYYYRLKQTDFSGSYEYSNIIEAIGQPTEFSLSQNYPNPFNPTTTISFSLPVQSQVHLLLIDVLGNVVKDVAEGIYEAGTHKVTLDASNLASGVYFYKLEAGNFISIKKLMLMK